MENKIFETNNDITYSTYTANVSATKLKEKLATVSQGVWVVVGNVKKACPQFNGTDSWSFACKNRSGNLVTASIGNSVNIHSESSSDGFSGMNVYVKLTNDGLVSAYITYSGVTLEYCLNRLSGITMQLYFVFPGGNIDID